MEYLVEVHWNDPTANSVARIFSTLPAEVERETGEWPGATSRAFCVLRARDPEALTKIVDAISEAGADTRVITRADEESRPA